ISPLIAGIVLLLIAGIDLTLHNGSFKNSSENPADKYVVNDELKNLLKIKPPNDLFRVSMRAPGVMAMQRNQGLVDSIMLYEGYNQLLLKRRNPPTGLAQQTLDLLNMRYEIQVDTVRGGAGFAQRPTHFPRAWMTYDAIVTDSAQVHGIMYKSSIDFKKTAILEERPKMQLSKAEPSAVNHQIKCLEYNNNSLKYSVTTSEPGVFVLSELYYPAWQAYLDGKPVRTMHAYHALRALDMPAGTHTVEMRYESQTFKTGAMITAFTLSLALMGMVIEFGLDRKKIRNYSEKN
ncbi:MAG TPA: YfhO family protein, partial [Patescibacteria group bacterium]|nr:YfhO family protein [Patescibacteria group bacterium]